MKPTAKPLLNGESHPQSHDQSETTKPAPESHQRSNADVIPLSCLFKNDSSVLSPLIFTKKIPNLKMDDRMSTPAVMLESMYALVNKFYYKSAFDLAEFLRELFANYSPPLCVNEPKQRRNRLANSVRRSNRIRKNGKQTQKMAAAEEKNKEKPSSSNTEDNNILDFLISPIKTDYCLGCVIRELDNQRTRDFRGRNLHFRETLRHDR